MAGAILDLSGWRLQQPARAGAAGQGTGRSRPRRGLRYPSDAPANGRGARVRGLPGRTGRRHLRIAAGETAAELAELGEGARARKVIGAFAALAEAMVPELSAVVRRWRPDVLMRDATAFAAWIVADDAGIPAALFDFAGVPPSLAARVAGPTLNRLRAAFGLPADPALASVYRWLVLIGAPPGWSDLDQLAPTAHLLQPPEFDLAPIVPRPGWLDSLKGRSRLVYATLGTVFGDSPDIWAAISSQPSALP
jgi:hypothetical protein